VLVERGDVASTKRLSMIFVPHAIFNITLNQKSLPNLLVHLALVIKMGFGMFYVSSVNHFPRHIDENKDDPEFSIDCTDPMGRSALITAVDNENMDMLQMLLENGVQVKVSHPLNYIKKTEINLTPANRMHCLRLSESSMLRVLRLSLTGRKKSTNQDNFT
jgi:hypothetical protein